MTRQPASPENPLTEYLKQELILLTRIEDITKQIEVQTRQSEIQMGSLVDQRQLYLDRLKKCRQMIESVCAPLPPEQRERQKKILAGQFPQKECSPEEARLLELGAKCRMVLQRTLATDREARERLQRECSRTREQLLAYRKGAAVGKYPVGS